MFFDANTEGNQNAVPTKESVNTRRMLAKALMESSSRVKPIDHWLQGVAQLGDGLAGAYLNSKADKQTQAGKDSIKGESDSLMSALFNRANPPKSDGGDIYGNVSLGAPLTQNPATEPNSSALPQSFLAALDNNEGGGNYDTLFGNAQNKGPFAGTKISGMTIGDALKFSDPSGDYANSVNQQIGRIATPMGRHQIVGTTLRNASQQMGLDPSTPFDQGTQDSIAMHLAKTRVASADTMGGKINALRQEWEGLKNVPDAQMAQIVSDLESGNAQSPTNQQPVQVASNDPQFMPVSAPPMPNNTQAQQIPQPASSVAEVQPSAAAQTPPQMQIGSPEIMQKAMHVLQSEWADDTSKAMAQHYLDMVMKQQQDAQDPAYQMKMQQGGIDLKKSQAELDALVNPKAKQISEADKLAREQFEYKKAEAGNDWKKLSDGALFNEKTGEVKPLPDMGSSVDFKDISTLRKEAQDTPQVKNYMAAAPIYRSMVETAGRNSKASDLNMVYGLGKIMDPTSVVREGEMVMVKNTASIPDWLQGAISSLNGGAALTSETRKAIMTEAKSRMGSYANETEQLRKQYEGIAGRNKINMDDIWQSLPALPDYTGDVAPTSTGIITPNAPIGGSPKIRKYNPATGMLE
jgi:hypothetical protein